MRFIGTPLGSSPMMAVGCEPMGLKYLSRMALMGAPLLISSRMISSFTCFVLPYGLSAGLMGASSVTGRFSGSGCPYTVQLDEKMIPFTLCFGINSRRLRRLVMLLR